MFIFNQDLRQSLPKYFELSFWILYIMIYRPVVCGIRLLKGNKIPKSKFWYNFIPGWDSKYFSFLFFNL